MERLTNKDWHTTKFLNLDNREVLKRLWELENMLEEEKVKQKERYMIEYNNPECKSVASIVPVLAESNIDDFNIEVSIDKDFFITTKDMLFKTKAEAEDCLKWLEEHNFYRYSIRSNDKCEDRGIQISHRPYFQHLEDAINKYDELIDTAGFNYFELYIIDLYKNKVVEVIK